MSFSSDNAGWKQLAPEMSYQKLSRYLDFLANFISWLPINANSTQARLASRVQFGKLQIGQQKSAANSHSGAYYSRVPKQGFILAHLVYPVSCLIG